MDALTHTLAAWALWRSRLLPREAGPWGALAMLAAANAADSEGMLRVAGAAVYLRNYHGAAHSLLGGVALAAAIAALAAWGLRRAGRAGLFPALFVVALAGAVLHLLLDLLQGYGVRLFWPVSPVRFGTRLMADFDVANLAVLLVALAVPMLLNMVNLEIGARRVDHSRFAIAGLVLVALLVPVRFYLRNRAETAASTVLAEDYESYGVHPSPFLLWHWYAVQETPIAYLVQEVDGASGQVNPAVVRFRKPLPNNLLLAARDTPSGREFLDMSLYPLFSLEEGRRGVVVRIRDLQFYLPGAGDRPYSIEIEVNSQMRVLRERALF